MNASGLRIAFAALLCSIPLAALAVPTLVKNVDGYTLADDKLVHFTALVFEDGCSGRAMPRSFIAPSRRPR